MARTKMPQLKKPPIFGKWKAEPLPEVPADWVGTRPEYYIFRALLSLGYKDRFIYQSPQMGGRLTLGGAVVDFLIPELNLGINIQSTYFHYIGAETKARDQIQRAQLEGYGITMIYIDEEDALRNPKFYTSEALAGRQHGRMAG